MLKRIMSSPAMAVALVALFVALGSGAYAQVSANSVGTAQLRNGAVTNSKLAHNSVWHAQLGRRVARNNNLADNSVWHAQLGGGVVRRNNVSAPLLAELGPARTVFAEGATGHGIPTNHDTQLLFEVRGAGAGPCGPTFRSPRRPASTLSPFTRSFTLTIKGRRRLRLFAGRPWRTTRGNLLDYSRLGRPRLPTPPGEGRSRCSAGGLYLQVPTP